MRVAIDNEHRRLGDHMSFTLLAHCIYSLRTLVSTSCTIRAKQGGMEKVGRGRKDRLQWHPIMRQCQICNGQVVHLVASAGSTEPGGRGNGTYAFCDKH